MNMESFYKSQMELYKKLYEETYKAFVQVSNDYKIVKENDYWNTFSRPFLWNDEAGRIITPDFESVYANDPFNNTPINLMNNFEEDKDSGRNL